MTKALIHYFRVPNEGEKVLLCNSTIEAKQRTSTRDTDKVTCERCKNILGRRR